MAWKRITLIMFVLIGSATFFSYWSINQFNHALNDLSDSSLASTGSVYLLYKQKVGLASTSPEISGELATSTESTDPEIATTTLATSTDPELSFTFPQKNDEVFIGCTYQLSWQSSTTISSLKTALVDAGTGEFMGPITSGLAKENAIEKDLQNLNWKVGVVWPGKYYIKVSNINGIDLETRSKVFTISKIPRDISANEKEKNCKESDGSF